MSSADIKRSFLLALGCAMCIPAAVAASAPATIVVLGSSTAQGTGASSVQTSWVGLLAAALPASKYTVKNVSIGGTNTSDSLNRFDHDVTPYQPAFVILATSLINEPASTAVQTYVSNTLLLIHKVESIGAIPILVPPYPNDGFNAETYTSIHDIFATAGAQGLPIFDFLDGADDGQGHWVAGLSLDGTHPTDVGHKLLFDSIPLTLFDALLRPAPPVDPRGFGSWLQESDILTEGDVQIVPDSAMGSWTISFWTRPSPALTERTLLDVNAGWLQLRRTGTEWRLWRGGAVLADIQVSTMQSSHHIALTYQAITGTLKFYMDSVLRSRIVVTAAPVSTLALGCDPGNAGWNATGDGFADIILYRAPLAATDIQAIFGGQPPWKSVEAWLPLANYPDRPWRNLAASTVTTLVHGTWEWSSQAIAPPRRPLPVRTTGR